MYLQLRAHSSYSSLFLRLQESILGGGGAQMVHRPNVGAWAGVVKAETEIKTNGVS